jgi:hypothetical protein
MPAESWTPEALSAHLADAIARTPVQTHPSPHLFIENALPDEFYETLRARLPLKSAPYKGWAIGKEAGRTHYQQRKQIYLHNRAVLERSDLGSPEVREFWLNLQTWFVSPEMRDCALGPFEAALRARFDGDVLPGDGEVVTNGMINFHEAGYFIGPHPDTKDRIVTAIFYLAEDEAPEEIGTHFYVPKDPAYASAKHGEFADFDRVATAPYRRNAAVLFLRTANSYHGVEPISEDQAARSDRYVLQYMLIHKR